MIGCWSKWWRGSACLYGASCPNQPLQLTPAAILVLRGSSVLQRPPQLNFAFAEENPSADNPAAELEFSLIWIAHGFSEASGPQAMNLGKVLC